MIDTNRQYKNPIVEEAIVELHFQPNLPWSPKLSSTLQRKFRVHGYTEARQVGSLSTQLVEKEDGVSQVISQIERVLIASKKHSGFFQIGPDLFAVNRLRKYPGWRIFRKQTELGVKTLNEAAKFKQFAKVVLRYVNLFQYDHDAASFPEFVRVLPDFKFGVDAYPGSRLADFAAEYAFELRDHGVAVTISIAQARRVPLPMPGLIVNLAVMPLRNAEPVLAKNAMTTIDRYHDILIRFFESTITDKLRAEMNK